MITAKDIHKKKFEKVKFGYSPEEVDLFLSELENDLRLMEQQVSDSNEKIQLLADKVREYKETEEDLRNALVGAQKQAREVIAAAKERAEQIEAEARQKVDSVKSQALIGQEAQLQAVEQQIAERTAVLEELKQMVSDFKQQLLNMYKGHLRQLAQLPEGPAAPASAAAESAAAEQPEPPAAETAEAEDKPDAAFGSRRDDRRKRN